MWDLSCPDWEQRIRDGRSLIPDLPLIRSEAEMGLAIFDELRLPDVPGKPRLGDAAGEWFREIVATSFGSWDPVARVNYVRDIYCLAPKGSSKTSYGAGLVLSVMLMNKRPRAEALFIGPTQAVSDRAYEQAVGMIDESPDLKRRFRPRDHIKTIEDLVNGSEMKVKTFDLKILTGGILIFAHLDEVHLLGRVHYAGKVIRQIRGGIDKTPEGKFLITTTQSDEIPAGAHKDEVLNARRHRDGKFRGKNARPTLAVMYEFPEDIATDAALWKNTTYWPMVQPNLGRSVHLETLIPDWNSEKEKGEHAIRVWASQYLNIEMGIGLKTDRWRGADYWLARADKTITLEALFARCEVIVAAVDGGGLDDLLALALIGRERITRRWLLWNHTWAHRGVLELRKEEAARLLDFEAAGELIIVDDMTRAFAQLARLVAEADGTGLLALVGMDPMGVGLITEALAEEEIEGDERVVAVSQGWKLNGSIKTLEVKLSTGELIHGGELITAWAAGNAKAEAKGNAVTITKQVSGSGKIDPLIAACTGVALMSTNPTARISTSVYDDTEAYEAAFGSAPGSALPIGSAEPDNDGESWSPEILADMRHPLFGEHKARFERWQDAQPDGDF